jgi:hypothetical protein
MTRTVVLALWGLVALGVVACAVLPVLTKGRFATFLAYARWLTRTRPAFALIFLGWLWLGWHLFAR